jgi:hypothetical protein
MPTFRHVGTDTAPATDQVIVAEGAVADYYSREPGWRADDTQNVPRGVDRLKGPALDEALKAADLPTTGHVDEKRARLTGPVTDNTQEK